MQYGALSTLTQPQGRATCGVDSEVPVGIGVEFAGPVTGTIELVNAASTILARGRLHVIAMLPCDRCLEKRPVELDIVVNEECRLAQVDQPTVEGAEDAEPIPILDADTVDLSELVRQVIAVNIPPRSLCRPDCRGLCPHCGQNRNEGSCSCDEEQVDERWAGLRSLLDQ